MRHPSKITIIVTTYNRPSSLELVVYALARQDISGFEVIIADDGSDEKTEHLITKLKKTSPFPLHHVWQPNEGFRAAQIRNRAASKARGDYFIFLDGDCVPPTSFVRKHLKLAENNWFVSGNRILLNPALTQDIIDQQLQQLQTWPYLFWLKLRVQGKINRMLPIYHLPLGFMRKLSKHNWKGAKTCNLAVWKKDFFHVNGFNESYIGWGYEDSDLVIRLIRAGIKRKMGKFCIPVFHLWHQPNHAQDKKRNLDQLETILNSTEIKAKEGVAQYIDSL